MSEKVRTVNLKAMLKRVGYEDTTIKYPPQIESRKPSHVEVARSKKERQQANVVDANEFWANYKHPLWQKKRLEVMHGDNFMCRSCGAANKTLNVHHSVPYRKGVKPWEYEDYELITLCEECHEEITKLINFCRQRLMELCESVDSALEMAVMMRQISGISTDGLKGINEAIFKTMHK